MQVRRIGGTHRNVAEKRAVQHVHHEGVARDAAVARHDGQVGVERSDLGLRGPVRDGQRRLDPRIPGRPPAQRDGGSPLRPDRHTEGRATQGAARRVGDLESREESAAPRVHRVHDGAPPVGPSRRHEGADEHHGHEHGCASRGAAQEPPFESGREPGTGRRELRPEPLCRTPHEHARVVRELHDAAHGAVTHLVFALHRIRDRLAGRLTGQRARSGTRDPRGERNRHGPYEERDGTRQRDPLRSSEQRRTEGERRQRRDRHLQQRAQVDQSGNARALARDQLEDRHEAGRLVTA